MAEALYPVDPITGIIDISALAGIPEDFTEYIAACNKWLCIALGQSSLVPVADANWSTEIKADGTHLISSVFILLFFVEQKK